MQAAGGLRAMSLCIYGVRECASDDERKARTRNVQRRVVVVPYIRG